MSAGAKTAPVRLNAFAYARYLVDAQVTAHDHVAGPQGRTGYLVEVGGKAVLIKGTVERYDGSQLLDR